VKTYLLSAVALSLCLSASAVAAQDSDTVNIHSSVPAYCQSMAGLDGASLALGALSDGVGQVVTTFAGDTTANLATYYCNSPTTISLEARPLMVTPSVPIDDDTSFTGQVDYLASLTWSDVTGSDESAADGATDIVVNSAKTGELIVSVSDPSTDGNLRPVSGAYEGSVVLNVNVN
jgi:hypothetical protein